MCGRFTLSTDPEDLARAFGVVDLPELSPRYNVAPSQPVAAVRVVVEDGDGQRQVRLLRWGLVPSWARDLRVGNRMINARSETAAGKPAFRRAFRFRRCLVLADGFYEWRRRGKERQPHYFTMKDGRPFAFAGLWERWVDPTRSAERGTQNGEPGPAPSSEFRVPSSEVVESCTLLTCGPNELVEPVHDRMPVILPPSDHDLWLDPKVDDPDVLQPLLRPFPAGEMTVRRVSERVNSPRNDDPSCVARMEQIELFQ